jgi:hypothetical protein
METIGTATGVAVDVLTGLPEPVKKNLWAALSQFCTATVGLATAHIEGRRNEILSVYDARVSINQVVAQKIAAQASVPKEYVDAAAYRSLAKIVGEQKNMDAIVRIAAAEVVKDAKTSPQIHLQAPQTKQESTTTSINPEWLNAFESEASGMSSEEMRLRFGKILAGEIKSPGSFSVRALRLMSEIDAEVADLFTQFCSLAIAMNISKFEDVRLPTMHRNPEVNGFREWGLGFRALLLLREAGLLTTGFENEQSYKLCVPTADNFVHAFLTHQGVNYVLVRKPGLSDTHRPMVQGISLTSVGAQLFSIVTPRPTSIFLNEIKEHFNSHGYVLTRADTGTPA